MKIQTLDTKINLLEAEKSEALFLTILLYELQKEDKLPAELMSFLENLIDFFEFWNIDIEKESSKKTLKEIPF